MITLLGAAPNTGNQGVSALCYSAVSGFNARGVDGIVVADHGRGLRCEQWKFGQNWVNVNLVGISHTRRVWRGDCLRTIETLSRLGGLGNAAARAVLSCDSVLDVSGGDSFTDLYGEKRFQAMCKTKRLALDNGRPLILLPQTLGPFVDPAKKAEAVAILAAATAIWVRDQKSYDFLKEELGNRFDPTRHHLGVEMAVLLPATAPATPLPEPIAAWLSNPDTPVAGLNVSGLLCRNAEQARRDFGLKENHTNQLHAAAKAILDSDPAMKLALISHVIRDPQDAESDWAAARDLEKLLTADYPGRVATLPQEFDATELKWIISHLDWFAGARMHATIAGISSGVPTLGLGYSDKADGVFRQCGLDGHVADLRTHDARQIAAAVRSSLASRVANKAALAESLDALKARASSQMDLIVKTIKQSQSG